METPWRIFEETQPIKLYAKNQMIYLQEETAIRFYYLKKGRVKIFLSSPDGLEKTLAVLQPGSLFGEASFLTASRAFPPPKHWKKAKFSPLIGPAWNTVSARTHSWPFTCCAISPAPYACSPPRWTAWPFCRRTRGWLSCCSPLPKITAYRSRMRSSQALRLYRASPSAVFSAAGPGRAGSPPATGRFCSIIRKPWHALFLIRRSIEPDGS